MIILVRAYTVTGVWHTDYYYYYYGYYYGYYDYDYYDYYDYYYYGLVILITSITCITICFKFRHIYIYICYYSEPLRQNGSCFVR